MTVNIGASSSLMMIEAIETSPSVSHTSWYITIAESD